MKKWKYHSLVLRDLSISEAKLNAEGEKGWELVSMCLVDMNTARAYFKMPVEEQAETSTVAPDAAVVQVAAP